MKQNNTSSAGQNFPTPPHGAAPTDTSQDKCEPPIDTFVEQLSHDHGQANPSEPASDADWREVFLRALAKVPIVAMAIKTAGVSRTQACEQRNNDCSFARLWDEAVEHGIDQVMAVAYQGAVYGERQPVYRQGMQIGWSTNHSRPMQAMLLQALRPKVFGKKNEPKETQQPKVMTLEEFRKRCAEADAMEDSEQV